MQVDQFKSSDVPTNRDEPSGSEPVIHSGWRWTGRSAAVTWGGTSPDVAVNESLPDVVGQEFGERLEVPFADEDSVVRFNAEAL